MLPPRPSAAPAPGASGGASTPEGPKKKRRTLRDAEQELEDSRLALADVKRKLVLTARENAKMKVLLMKYIDRDDSLLSSSQLSVGEASSQQSVTADAAPPVASSFKDVSRPESAMSLGVTTEEEDSETSTMWADDFAADDAVSGVAAAFEPVSQLSQISQASHWSEISSTSNLDEIINFLDSHDKTESDRMTTLQTDYKRLRDQKTVVRVGVGVLLMSKKHPGCVLIGRRKGSHGEGKMALPGGHLEMYESWEDCAVREVKEETDLDIAKPTFAHVTNDPMEDEDKHYITILMQAEVDDAQTPKNMEPNKCEGWSWVQWQELAAREDMFTPLLHLTHSSFQPSFV